MANHRAQHRAPHRAPLRVLRSPRLQPVDGRPSVVAAPGRRRAEKLRPVAFRFPAVPTVVGLMSLLAAGTGAVLVDEQPTAQRTFQLSSAGHSHSGTDAVRLDGTPRERALSRDSERQAMQDAAQATLEAAAEQDAAERNAALKSLGKAAEARAGEIAKNQWHLPTRGYRLTGRFGSSGSLWSSNHTGLDFATSSGTPIVAVANGVITETGSAGAYGNRTIQTLDDGTEIWYCHQSSIGVTVGQRVVGGTQIGTVGSTGNSTGPHLHLEVRPGGGDPVDPGQALAFHGVAP